MNDEQTEKALDESIAHWERMRDNRKCGEQPHVHDCSLCKLFYSHESIKLTCINCPVYNKTGLVHCKESPYTEAAQVFYYFNQKIHAEQEWKIAAQAEIDFLKSLKNK